jgi:transcriptional regulator with XRE-family HTH domain
MNKEKLLQPFEEENHEGRNIQRIRVYLGVKQEVLAKELGLSQPQISQIEQEKEVSEPMLKRISEALGVTPELIRKFNVERAIYNISSNNYKDATINEGASAIAIANQNNPIDKVIELYERLLKSEREKLEILLNRRN